MKMSDKKPLHGTGSLPRKEGVELTSEVLLNGPRPRLGLSGFVAAFTGLFCGCYAVSARLLRVLAPSGCWHGL